MRTLIRCMIASAILLYSCQAETSAQHTNMLPVEFKSFLENNSQAQLIDVRTSEEFKDGKIAKAINIDVSDANFENLLKRLDKDKPTLVYCLRGRRSVEAAKILQKNGFKHIINLEGGIKAWQNNGLAVD